MYRLKQIHYFTRNPLSLFWTKIYK